MALNMETILTVVNLIMGLLRKLIDEGLLDDLL